MLTPMLLRRAPGIVAAFLLLPLLVLAPIAHDVTAMVCRMTGTVSWQPCEPTADQQAEEPEHDALVDESCCDFIRMASPHPSFERAFRPELPRPAVVVVPRAEVSAFPISPDERGVAVGGPGKPAPVGLGPPVRQVTQTFLL
jgi:hypothetical protein